jgi:hypothetical protein
VTPDEVTLDHVRRVAHEATAELAAEAPTMRLDSDDDVPGLIAFFGEDRSRRVVRVVIAGDDAGYVDRRDVLGFFDSTPTMGYGDSARATLMGHPLASAWQLHELECPVADCPESPVYVARFRQDRPPRCRVHPDHELRLRS